ncbi:ABC-type dipeptide transport system, periplasmic component [Sanguibacter keddieii DSM 10542]|uniref:ABC-type dipeptide transport system, periplasmic component n=1 Tax=Sanguibacter keddieii (strain ATCC 51767 / DSM 10542 / NCFB 3025 / ST-74) TaxID=446469 RepID=D1BEP3_SANKS|nr:ABC transporter substrate-binding protein [Sanguibacter keddieii]ACZ23329.1 ABC-type dipeptide transport system, periplasmic component [Sanguibacter keddieii DSM 10542]
MRPTQSVLPAAVVATALLLSACGGGSTASTGGGSDDADLTPVAGGTLRYGLQADPQCLDPRQGGLTVSLTVTRSVVDSLLDQDPETGDIEPWLAESWEVNEDASEFTYHLRDDVTFSDGEPLTAELVKKNFDSIADLGPLAGLPLQYLTGYEGTEVVDEHTAKISFSAPNAQFLQASSSMSLGLLSSASLDKTPEELCTGAYAASGPFVIDSYEPSTSVVITRRDGYDWAPGRAAHTGDAYLDRVEFSVIPEGSVRTGSLVSGQLEVIGDVPTQDLPQLQSGDQYQVVSRPNPGNAGGFLVNTTRPVLDDPTVREALLLGVDRSLVSSTLFFDEAPPATAVLSSSTPGWSDLSDSLAYDADAAAAALEDAGWVAGSDGVREKDGQRLTIEATWNPAIGWGKQVLEFAQQDYAKIGVELTIRTITLPELNQVLGDRDYDLFYNSQTRPDPDVLWGNFSPANPANRHGGTDDELAAVLDEQRTTTDPAVRFPLVETAQELILADGFTVPIVESVSILGAASTVHGIDWEASSKPVFYDIWISQG